MFLDNRKSLKPKSVAVIVIELLLPPAGAVEL
jgi:hypothetical protein